MFPSIGLSVAFTVTFVVTGAYALVRYSLITADAIPGGDRVAELSHLLMSVAMVAMTWGAGMGTPARTLQIAVFGGSAVWFLRRAVLGRHGSGHARSAALDHAVTAVAMVWMVAAMPLIMGMSMADGSGGGHAGHGGHGADAVPSGTDAIALPTPTWVTAVSVVLVALLAGGALFWVVRAWRGASQPPVDEPGDGGGAVRVRTRTATSRTRLAALAGARQDALCHVLMSVGMGAMLVAML